MSLNIGAILATLSLDNSGFKKGFLEAQAVTSTFGATFAAAVTNPVLGAVSLFKSLAGRVAHTSEALLGMAQSLDVLGQQTGLTAGAIQTVRAAVEDAGGSAQAGDAALFNFNRRLYEAQQAGSAAGKELAQLGINVNAIGRGDKGLNDALDQLSRITDEGARANAAFALFGREGSAAILSISSGGSRGFAEMRAEFEKTGRVLSNEVIGKLGAANTRVDALKSGLKGLEQGLTSDFLIGLADGLGRTDASVIGLATSLKNDLGPAARDLGLMMGEAVNALRDLIELIKKLDEALGAVNYAPDGKATKRDIKELMLFVREQDRKAAVATGRGPTAVRN